MAIAIALPGLIEAAQCPLTTGSESEYDSRFSAYWTQGDGDMHTSATYSDIYVMSIDCMNYGENCSGTPWNDPNNTVETDTYVTRSYTWGTTQNRLGKSRVKIVGTVAGALATVNG